MFFIGGDYIFTFTLPGHKKLSHSQNDICTTEKFATKHATFTQEM